MNGPLYADDLQSFHDSVFSVGIKIYRFYYLTKEMTNKLMVK
jgi:hypothetical protein